MVLLGATSTHGFGQSWNLAFNDATGCFRGYVTWAEACSAGGEKQRKSVIHQLK
jgi:hypothetical protein